MTTLPDGFYLNDYISYLDSERETLEQLIDERKDEHSPSMIQSVRSLNRQLEEVNEKLKKAKEEIE